VSFDCAGSNACTIKFVYDYRPKKSQNCYMSSSVIFIDCSDFGNNNYVFSFNDNFFIAISYRLYSVHIHLNVSSFIEIRQLQVLYGFYLLRFRAWFQLFCLCSLYSATGATVEHHLTVIRVVMGRVGEGKRDREVPQLLRFFPRIYRGAITGSHPPSHIHCFIPGSKITFSTNLFHAPTWT